MEFSFAQSKQRRVYLLYSLVFILIAACMYGTYLVTGNSLIWNKDPLNQHVPLLIEYRKAVLHFLTHPLGPHQWWSWRMGLGSDTFAIFSYYTIGDVFAYLALLFPAGKMVLAYQVMVVLRLYCAGLAFVWFARHFKLADWVIVAGAVVYLVNSYLLYASLAQPFFTTTFILFPLLVVQVERILQGGSWWPLAGAFVWMLVNNYYLAYVLGIGTFLFLVLRVLTHYRGRLDYGVTILKLGLATVTSLLLSAVLLVPEVLTVMNSTRAGSTFANGLTTYPAYYYLFLPKALINGGQWSFMFWAALGIVSFGFLALVYVYLQPKRYPLLALSLALALVMLLIPAVGAFFNGLMAASNRWTLLIYLPIAMAVCFLLQHVGELTRHQLLVMSWATGVYLLVVLATYFLKNDAALFVPLTCLLGGLLLLWLIHAGVVAHPGRWLLALILANAGFNAIYAAFPYNGDFASAMLPRGAYQRLTTQRYGGLEKGLSKQPTYRVSTLSQNDIVSDVLNDNDLTTGMHNIDSYYSLQNQYLGQFSQDLQNTQYQANVPLRQVDDRSVWLNFLGVKYLFAQTNGANATKWPQGYFLDQATEPQYDYNAKQPAGATKKEDLPPIQTVRLKSQQNFPLLYWQSTAITPAQYRQLGPTAKERALASGVVVADHVAQKLTPADLTGNVVKLKSQLISNRFNQVNPANLHYRDAEETYQLVLPQLTNKQFAKRLKESELHVEFQTIKYQPLTLKQQLAAEMAHAKQTANFNPGAALNEKSVWYKYWRYHLINGSPDISYTLQLTSKYGTEKISQPKQSVLSFFKVVKNGTMNVGYFAKHLPTQLTFKPTKLGTYHLKYQVVAARLGDKYQSEVRQIQAHGLKKLHFAPNTVSGQLTTSRYGVLTSSIPYSKGWTATVDGHPAPVLRTNAAFVGLALPAGNHRIKLTYHVPGLRVGAIISLIGLGWTALLAGITWWVRHHRGA
ncbi:YfhO family protein [Limosilactobacillus ingluviei]|uniref:YfhO family protein n=1 Tax=Limosilactobacillus ingluviei TaxID=148604 RepID=UPI00195E7203|nr:YfhO family protein [Limosilactobacillus ingluviei]MBM6728244.1 YfhO family protein [Limosilactobacillus ingluviei]